MNIQNGLRQDLSPVSEPGDEQLGGNSGFRLVDLLHVLRVRWQIIVGTAVIIMAVTLVVLFQLTPLYRANAVVMLDQRKNNVEDVNAVLSGLPTDPSSIQNQVQILTSRELASRVVGRLKLEQDPDFNGDLEPGWGKLLEGLIPTGWFAHNLSTLTAAQVAEKQRNQLIDKVLDRLSVEPIGLSTAIMVSFTLPNPEHAARVVNTIADEYVEDQLNAKFVATQKATQWLADRIQELSRQVQAADAAVQQYKAENNLTETADGSSIVNQQLASVNAQLIAAKSDLAQKQAIYGRVLALARVGRSDDVSQVVASPLIGNLRAEETTLLQQEATLSTQYGPRHPKILEIESEKRNLEDRIRQEVQRVVGTVANDVAVSSANMNSLQNSLTGLSSQSQGQSLATVKLKALEAAALSSRSMYEAYISRLKETQGQEGIQSPDARVISTAEIPSAPSFPNKLLIVGAALPMSLVLGLLFAFAAERLDSGFRTSAQVETSLGLPVLAIVPEIKVVDSEEEINAADRIVDKPMSSFTEAIRGLQLGLSLSNVDVEPKIILVTSSVPSEGKSTIAISLARLAARTGKRVALVDGDLRHPTIAKMVGLISPEYGIGDALSGKEALDRCLVKDPRSTVLILPCVEKPPSPADLLSSAAMERLITTLRNAFDVVIFDTAPLLPVNDTKILARLADTVLFVTRWEKTPRDAAYNAVRSLADVNVAISGVALTRADTKRSQYYNYGYQNYHQYNKYYSE